MNIQKKLRVLFTPKAEFIFFEIIKKYNMKEIDEKLNEKYARGEETYAKIIRDTVKIMATETISEEKLSEILEKHLGISKDIIINMIQDFKNKLLPLLLVYPNEKFSDPIFREEVSKKIFGENFISKKEIPLYSVKKVEIKNVEENEKKIITEGKIVNNSDNNIPPQNLVSKADKYREQF